MNRLFGRLVLDGEKLFQATSRYTAHILLHENLYVAEKAFVHGVWLMYQWIGAGWLPEGEFRWPPERN